MGKQKTKRIENQPAADTNGSDTLLDMDVENNPAPSALDSSGNDTPPDTDAGDSPTPDVPAATDNDTPPDSKPLEAGDLIIIDVAPVVCPKCKKINTAIVKNTKTYEDYVYQVNGIRYKGVRWQYRRCQATGGDGKICGRKFITRTPIAQYKD